MLDRLDQASLGWAPEDEYCRTGGVGGASEGMSDVEGGVSLRRERIRERDGGGIEGVGSK